METFYVNNFKIPTQYALAIQNGDELTNEEQENLESFLSDLPSNGIWDFGDIEPEMETFNDVDSYRFSDCYMGVYTVFKKGIPPMESFDIELFYSVPDDKKIDMTEGNMLFEMDLLGFELYVDDKNMYRLKDLQGANLANIENDSFDTIHYASCRLENYSIDMFGTYDGTKESV